MNHADISPGKLFENVALIGKTAAYGKEVQFFVLFIIDGSGVDEERYAVRIFANLPNRLRGPNRRCDFRR